MAEQQSFMRVEEVAKELGVSKSYAYKIVQKLNAELREKGFVLSAVMHADERNRAMSEALGQDVFHYHLHVVYIPVVEKEIRWSKRCKDEALRGTVKERIMQVSSSKKWLSKPAVDDAENPILQKNGKPVLRKSYSVLQDNFFNAMRNAGYDVERGERGSSEEHLTVTQFKVEREQERLAALSDKIEKKEQTLQKYDKKLSVKKGIAATFHEIDSMGSKTVLGNISMTPQEAHELKDLAKECIASRARIPGLEQELKAAKKEVGLWKSRYEKLYEQTKDFLAAVKRAPSKVKEFVQYILHAEPEFSISQKNRELPQCRNRGMEL